MSDIKFTIVVKQWPFNVSLNNVTLSFVLIQNLLHLRSFCQPNTFASVGVLAWLDDPNPLHFFLIVSHKAPVFRILNPSHAVS